MQKLKVKIVNKSNWPDPFYATEASAGMDLRANTDGPLVLQPLERMLVPTGIFIELPVGYEAQIRPRSGLATKKGITVINSPGTVVEDFPGEPVQRAFRTAAGRKDRPDGGIAPRKGGMGGCGSPLGYRPRCRRLGQYR